MASEQQAVIDREGLAALIGLLADDGYQVIGPRLGQGAIVYEPIAAIDDLPAGWLDEQGPGSYRLERAAGDALFAHVVGPHSWKRYLYPPEQKLWQSRRLEEGGFTIESDLKPVPRYAFLGVRACELQALAVQDRVFGVTPVPARTMDGSVPVRTKDVPAPTCHQDSGYAARRRAAFIVAVNCGRAAGTCFCVSMNSGPKVTGGFDLALTELINDGRHEFLIEAGSARGSETLARLSSRPAEAADLRAAASVVARAVSQNRRAMVPEAADLVRSQPDHKHWQAIAERCLSCANCTLVCPTCFCTTVEDTTDLTGDHAERWRRWDSCFTLEFSYIHGGPIRRETRSRYRQWMTHKLGTWHDQFGHSGCVGCGRCIAWCPVGIDITEEARALRGQ